jgi:phosphoribosylformylglycinamidine synthase subunit PurQ / glutaminase
MSVAANEAVATQDEQEVTWMTSESPRIALIQFPGSNCEWESKRAAEAAGLDCDVFRWNRPPHQLADYEGYIIGGGFSYQDRVRSGVIAAKEPIIKTVFDEVTEHGKPLIGICNGAQVMVEAGLVPGLHAGQVEMALAPNKPDRAGRIAQFCCRWVYVRTACAPSRCVFSADYAAGEVIPIPIAHGEGRFTTRDSDVFAALKQNDQIVFQYCDVEGNIDERTEICPNGAMANIAAICNPEGNAMAMMPHPERASFLRQIPYETGGPWGEKKRAAHGDAEAQNRPGPGLAVFTAAAAALRSRVIV